MERQCLTTVQIRIHITGGRLGVQLVVLCGFPRAFFPCQSHPVSNSISYRLPVFEYVQSKSTSHLLWWWYALLCFVVEMYGKWLDSIAFTEVIIWFRQILLQSIRQSCNICCPLNSLSDCPVGKVIFF